MVTLFAVTALSNAFGLLRVVRSDEPLGQSVVRAAGSLLALAFCALVVWAYLRRGPATATDRGVLVWLVAPTATALPLVLAAVPPRSGGALRTAAELTLTMTGLAFSVWAVRALSTNLSVIPQARSAVATGPYRLVRHPLYLGELVAFAGLALHVGRWPAALALVLQVGLQVYRALREEALLEREIPGYAEYAARTDRIVPWVW